MKRRTPADQRFEELDALAKEYGRPTGVVMLMCLYNTTSELLGIIKESHEMNKIVHQKHVAYLDAMIEAIKRHKHQDGNGEEWKNS